MDILIQIHAHKEKKITNYNWEIHMNSCIQKPTSGSATFIKMDQNYIYSKGFTDFSPFPLCRGYIYNVLDPRG